MSTIYRNNNYIVRVGTSMVVEDAQVYVAENLHTGIVEAEDQMLPRILDYADQLDERLIEMAHEGYDLSFKVEGEPRERDIAKSTIVPSSLN